MFWELWKLLAASSDAFKCIKRFLPDVWSADDLPMYKPLYEAFHTLLTWLLRFTRCPAWVLMSTQQGSLARTHDLIIILEQPTVCLVHVSFPSAAPKSVLISHLKVLPPHFIPLLCCIVSEQLLSNLPLLPRTQPLAGTHPSTHSQPYKHSLLSHAISPETVLGPLAGMLSNLGHSNFVMRSPTFSDCLIHPSVIHLLKACFITTAHIRCTTQSSPPLYSATALSHLLPALQIQLRGSPDIQLCPLASTELSTDDLGLPSHAHPVLSLQALELDMLLLNALSAHMDSDITLMTTCYSVQCIVIESWVLAGQMCHASDASLLLMTQCVVGLAKQCTLHGLLLLQHVRKQASLHPAGSQQPEGQSYGQKQCAQSKHGPACQEAMECHVWRQDGLTEMLDLMLSLNAFLQTLLDLVDHPISGM